MLIEKMFFNHEFFVKSVSLMMGKFGTFIETWDLVLSCNIPDRSHYGSYIYRYFRHSPRRANGFRSLTEAG